MGTPSHPLQEYPPPPPPPPPGAPPPPPPPLTNRARRGRSHPCQVPCVSTERFNKCFVNRCLLDFKFNFFFHLEVEIFVRMSTGTDVKFKLIESNTIKNVKERIQLSEDIPCEMQRLYFLCRLLKDKYTLCYYNIQNGSILHCDVLLIRIKVKMPTEDEISVDVSPDDKVRSARDRIQAIGEIPPDQLCLLVYNDEKLNNRFTLRHYKVRNGSILSLVKSGGTSITLTKLLCIDCCVIIF